MWGLEPQTSTVTSLGLTDERRVLALQSQMVARDRNLAGGPYMPVYDYVCHDCHKTFELILTLKEHEVAAKCPKCGSKNVEQEATAFYAVTPKKS
jgi:putative FmdB family regulatory protein